jgi:co-chaperonin GroES (HSP10)
MKFRPLHDRVVVKRIEADEKTAGASSSPTPPRRSRSKARSSPLALVGAMKPAS